METTVLFPNGVLSYVTGGLLIGLGVSVLFLTTGRVGGMSTFFSAAWTYVSRAPFFRSADLVQARDWRSVYAAGVIMGGAVFLLFGDRSDLTTQLPTWRLALGGVLGGYGARLSKGCTSGHGICGLASLQRPALMAVLTFMASAVVTAHVMDWLVGGAR